jgi:nitroreductase
MVTTGFDRTLSLTEVRWLVEQAGRAPSVHNSQPWRFTYGDSLDLWAETSRGMTASDPEGRELVLSCGAALYNLRVAARKIGFDAAVELLPDSAQPRLLARVSLREGKPADAMERREYAALTRRHTHRGGFDDKPLASDLAVYLQRAADVEGAMLIYVHQPGQRRRILQLAATAERELAANPRVQEEIAAWTPQPGAARRDGVPATAYPPRPRMHADDLPARDFDQGRGYGQAETDMSPPGVIAVIATEGDTQRDWLVAGQGMERALIRAAENWVFAALDSQLVELASTRSELRRALGISGHPQIVMRFGYAANAPATPRRPVDEVLDLVRP